MKRKLMLVVLLCLPFLLLVGCTMANTPTSKVEDLFSKYMYNDLPPIDLMIRTSGELRISNFLMYELSYAELYFTNTLFPDFNKEELYKAILDYQNRDRRFGKIGDK